MHDLVIRGGTVVDGSGGIPFVADIAIGRDRIVHVGPNAGKGAEEIDATGRIVTPGFVDLHTHYDAQIVWDPILAPTSWHGVTTVVVGNCGVGFAPVRPGAESWLIEIMENVEEIPRAVLEAGMNWDWESFPDYLDALEKRLHTVDIGTQMPFIALREYVMGERARRDEPATADDIAQMVDITEEALRAGALGFACTRTDSHRFADGRLVPGSLADGDELLAIAEGVRRAGHGAVQYLGTPLSNWEEDFAFMSEMARRANSSVNFLMVENDWRTRAAGISAAAREGVDLRGHVPPRATGAIQCWRSGRNPFMDRPSVRAIRQLPWEDRLAKLRDPAFRAQVLSEANIGEDRLPEFARAVYNGFDRMFEIADYPDYEPDPARDSVAARAAARGQDPAAYAYDVLTRNDGEGMIYLAIANYRTGDLEEVGQMIQHPRTIVSLSDGGAHCTQVIDATSTTFMLTHWARDRKRGAPLPLELVVKSVTSDPAKAYGLDDRGLLAPGYLADLNIIDFDALRLPAPYTAFDLPAGGQRLLQKAEGYVATVKRGQITFRDGEHQGRFPGQVIRGPQKAPQARAGAGLEMAK